MESFFGILNMLQNLSNSIYIQILKDLIEKTQETLQTDKYNLDKLYALTLHIKKMVEIPIISPNNFKITYTFLPPMEEFTQKIIKKE
ncbi:MAG: hypothetical protein ACP5QF_07900 [Desulfurella sp.]|uniref:hypothetical protein n=1 Tax=Desulfurella sp. TaxID=1962857 RepID=UPI003D13A7BF